jgi:hypothetical protein
MYNTGAAMSEKTSKEQKVTATTHITTHLLDQKTPYETNLHSCACPKISLQSFSNDASIDV